jgi:hypothetical protein
MVDIFQTARQLAERAKQASESIRTTRCEAAARVLPRVPNVIDRSVNGVVFVEEIGDVLEFTQGAIGPVYLPQALVMRGVSLRENADVRNAAFSAIAAGLSPSVILSVGAGRDTTLISAFLGAGHAVLSTDFAVNVVAELAHVTSAPTFAADLVDLKALFEESSIDYIIGNSTLGYVAPTKIKAVVEGLVSVVRCGGVFTFDLTPYPDYYVLARGVATAETCVNASRPDPQHLLECVSKYGKVQGIAAAAAYSNRLSMSVQLAVISVLRELFFAFGFFCTVTWKHLSYTNGMLPLFSLRVSREADGAALVATDGEDVIDDLDDLFANQIDFSKHRYVPSAMDRGRASALMSLMGASCNLREAPLRVVEECMYPSSEPRRDTGSRPSYAESRCTTRSSSVAWRQTSPLSRT